MGYKARGLHTCSLTSPCIVRGCDEQVCADPFLFRKSQMLYQTADSEDS